MLLIYWHTLRDFPYSDEEKTVSNNLIGMYYNFAKHNSAVYGGAAIEKTHPDDVKCMEIFSPEEYNMVQLDEYFGNGPLWDSIEETLSTKERTYYDEL